MRKNNGPPLLKSGRSIFKKIESKIEMYYNENTIIYWDGEFVKAAEAKGDVYSQSPDPHITQIYFSYGYGLLRMDFADGSYWERVNF